MKTKRLAFFFLLMVFCFVVVITSQVAWAETNVAQIREILGITPEEASDEQLQQFLKDKGNKIFIEVILKKIRYGQELNRFIYLGEPSLNVQPGIELIMLLAKKGVLGALKLLAQKIPEIAWPTAVIGVWDTLVKGAEIQKKLAKAIAKFDSRALLDDYIKVGREKGNSPEAVFQEMFPVFEDLIDKVICLSKGFIGRLKCTPEKITEGDKQAFATYLEFSYQSWKLATDPERRKAIKKYILNNLPPPNRPPIANAGPDRTVQVGSTVQLDGNGSDPDGDTLRYVWRFISIPPGSRAEFSDPIREFLTVSCYYLSELLRGFLRLFGITFTLTCSFAPGTSGAANPSFVADEAGDYLLELQVADGRGGTATDRVRVTAVETAARRDIPTAKPLPQPSSPPSTVPTQPGCTVTLRPGDSIQSAIDRVSPAVVICLTAGVWEEGEVEISKGLTLQGAGREQSILKGRISAQIPSNTEFVLRDVTLDAAGDFGSYIRGEGKIMIRNARFIGGRDYTYGLSINGSDVTVADSVFSNNLFSGLVVFGKAIFTNCVISDNGSEGVVVPAAEHVIFDHCTISRNGYSNSLHGGGIQIHDSFGLPTRVDIIYSTISENWGNGVEVLGGAQASIKYNTITNNGQSGLMVGGISARTENIISCIGNKVYGNRELDYLIYPINVCK